MTAKANKKYKRWTRKVGDPAFKGHAELYGVAAAKRKDAQGPATAQTCVEKGCNDPARYWTFEPRRKGAQIYVAPRRGTNEPSLPFSNDAADYKPRCSAHAAEHRKKLRPKLEALLAAVKED
jgi:hypothetical protein